MIHLTQNFEIKEKRLILAFGGVEQQREVVTQTESPEAQEARLKSENEKLGGEIVGKEKKLSWWQKKLAALQKAMGWNSEKQKVGVVIHKPKPAEVKSFTEKQVAKNNPADTLIKTPEGVVRLVNKEVENERIKTALIKEYNQLAKELAVLGKPLIGANPELLFSRKGKNFFEGIVGDLKAKINDLKQPQNLIARYDELADKIEEKRGKTLIGRNPSFLLNRKSEEGFVKVITEMYQDLENKQIS